MWEVHYLIGDQYTEARRCILTFHSFAEAMEWVEHAKRNAILYNSRFMLLQVKKMAYGED